MLLSNLSRREKSLFYITSAVILLSLFFTFVFKPLKDRWQELNVQILEKEIKLKKNTGYLRQQKTVEEIYLKYAPYVEKIGSDEEEIAALLHGVEKEARVAGVHIVNINPKPVKKVFSYKKYTLDINCEAALANYVEFVYNLQRSSQVIRVENLKLISPGGDSALLKASMLVTKLQFSQ